MNQRLLYIYLKKYITPLVVQYLYKNDYHFIILIQPRFIPSTVAQYIRINSYMDLFHFQRGHAKIVSKPDQYADICIIAKHCKTDSFKRRWVVHKELTKELPPAYTVNSSFLLNKRHKQSNQIFIYAVSNKCGKDAIFLTVGGYGDWFRHAYLIQAFLNARSPAIEVHHANIYSLNVGKLFLFRYNNYQIPHRFHYRLLKNNHYREVYNLSDTNYVAATRLRDLSLFLHNRVLPCPDSDNIDFNNHYQHHKILEIIRRLKSKYKYVIGVQFYTDHSSPNYRNYPEKYVSTFFNLCKKDNIYVLILAPMPYRVQKQKYIWDLSKTSILFMPYIVKELDCVVGIDSCFVHIAGLMQIPSIVLFNKVFAYSLSVLRNNYNLISTNGSPYALLPEIVYQRMIQLINRQLIVNQKTLREYHIRLSSNSEFL